MYPKSHACQAMGDRALWAPAACPAVAFTRPMVEAFTDDEYRALQEYLAARPDAGPVIPRGGGLRKLRWAAEGRGKRGGTRVIYYWATACGEILFLFVYSKNVQGDLSAAQLAALRAEVEREYPYDL